MQADLAKFDRVFFVMWRSAFWSCSRIALWTRRRAIPDARSAFWSCSRIALWTRRAIPDARSAFCELLRIALWTRRRRRRSQRKTPRSFLLPATARDSRRSQRLLELLAHRALDPPPSSSLAEERTPPLVPPPCDGARFPTLAAQCVVTPLALSQGCGLIALYTSPYLTPAG